METVVSGIRPTGNLHLGNYFGAVKSFLRMQDEYRCFFFIADWHSLTTHPRPEHIRQSVKTILAEYLAECLSGRIGARDDLQGEGTHPTQQRECRPPDLPYAHGFRYPDSSCSQSTRRERPGTKHGNGTQIAPPIQ